MLLLLLVPVLAPVPVLAWCGVCMVWAWEWYADQLWVHVFGADIAFATCTFQRQDCNPADLEFLDSALLPTFASRLVTK